MVYTAGPERSAQRNWGIGNSHGEYILVLDADMVLAPKLVEEAVNMFLKDPDLACLFVPEETRASGFWGKTKSFERDFYLVGDMSVEAVRFFRRRYLDKVGLFDEMQTGSEDWDLSDRFIFLHKYKYARTTERIVHDEGELLFGDLLKKKRYYIHSGIGEYLKHSPNPLRRLPFPLRPSVRAQWPRFIRHPFLAGMVLMMKTLEAMPLIWMRITKRRNLNASY
jgi:glycosyltransferase involved in cell wall biosynthesis